jgi:hypothetical protein
MRVRVEIMGPGKCGNVGESQPVLIIINPIISTRTRISVRSDQSGECPLTPRGAAQACMALRLAELEADEHMTEQVQLPHSTDTLNCHTQLTHSTDTST